MWANVYSRNDTTFTEPMIEALVNYMHVAYPQALVLSKQFDRTAEALIVGSHETMWPEIGTMNALKSYKQSYERQSCELNQTWPSISIVEHDTLEASLPL